MKTIFNENRKYILDFFLLPIRSKDFEYFIEVAIKFLALNPINPVGQSKKEENIIVNPFKIPVSIEITNPKVIYI
jgi:hypothetical protein